jgi:FkbM family methyltransferase
MIKEWIHAIVWAKRHWGGVLTAPEVRILTKYIERTDTFIDIGAHAGSWTVPMSQLLNGGRVIAVEALPYYAGVLRRCLSLLRCSNVKVVNAAATATPTMVNLIWKDETGKRLTGFTHIAGRDESTSGTITVPGIPLDEIEIGRGRLRLIKIDVEGAEFGVLTGAARMLQTHRPIIFMELAPALLARYDKSVADVFELLKGWSYRPYAVTPEMTLRAVSSAEDYREHDVVFVPETVSL